MGLIVNNLQVVAFLQMDVGEESRFLQEGQNVTQPSDELKHDKWLNQSHHIIYAICLRVKLLLRGI